MARLHGAAPPGAPGTATVPPPGAAPRSGTTGRPGDAHGAAPGESLVLSGPAVLAPGALERELSEVRAELAGERQRREAVERELTEIRVALARAEVRAEMVDGLRAEVDALRRPWIIRLVSQVRD